MTPTRARWIVALVSGTLATGLALWIVLTWKPAETPGLRFVTPRPTAALFKNAPVAFDAPGLIDPERPEDWPYHMPYAAYKAAFPFYERNWQYCPWTNLRRAPNYEKRIPWPEHPRGEFVEHLNDLGLREDHDGLHADAKLRVLVIGDSHTYGLCDNRDSFANRLESMLGEKFPGQSVEVLNTAMGGFSFFQYEGSLHLWRDFMPQVVVMCVFAGNDFVEFSFFEHGFQGTQPADWPEGAIESRDAAIAAAPSAMGQGYNSVLYLRSLPLEAEWLTAAAVRHTLSMRDSAAKRGASLLVCVLPSPCDFEWSTPPGTPEQILEARRILAYPVADLQLNARVAADYIARLERADIEAIDLTPALSQATPPPFWRRDLHLDLAGHEIVARELLSRLAPRLGR